MVNLSLGEVSWIGGREVRQRQRLALEITKNRQSGSATGGAIISCVDERPLSTAKQGVANVAYVGASDRLGAARFNKNPLAAPK